MNAQRFEKSDYCTRNGGDCSTCSLVNYGRDCLNNPIASDDDNEVIDMHYDILAQAAKSAYHYAQRIIATGYLSIVEEIDYLTACEKIKMISRQIKFLERKEI